MKPAIRTTLASAGLLAVASGAGHAGVTIDIVDVGADVVVTASGSLNLAALTVGLGNFISNGGTGMIDFGSGLRTSQGLVLGTSDIPYTLLTGPTFTGPPYPFFGAERASQEQVFFSSASGDLLSLGFQPFGERVGIGVAMDYVSGAPLSADGRWTGIELSRLGVGGGVTFAWEWGTGADADFLTINVIPEPETYALMIAGLGLIGACVRYRNRR